MSSPVPEKTYTLEVLSNSDDLPPGQWPWQSIFNTTAFFKLHTRERRGYYFSYLDANTRELVAVAHFAEMSPGVFVSPPRGTFGGYEGASAELSVLERFVAEVEKFLQQAGARSLLVTLKPFCHDVAGVSNLYNVLARQGYRATSCDLTYALPILPGELIDRMQRNNQKKVRKCQRDGFLFGVCATPEEYHAAYSVIAANREAKGYSISMTFTQLMQMREVFPDKMHFFHVTQAGKVIAGSVCLAISPRVFYVFYWGDLPGYETFSPVVLLAGGIHDYARERGFTLMDAGISTLESIPNHGLIRFKENLGFESSLKLGFRKEFTHA
jgi:predicted N-acyltransferase